MQMRTKKFLIQKFYTVLPVVHVGHEDDDKMQADLEYTIRGLRVEEYARREEPLKLFDCEEDAKASAKKYAFAKKISADENEIQIVDNDIQALQAPVVEICVITDIQCASKLQQVVDEKTQVKTYSMPRVHANFYVSGKNWLEKLHDPTRWKPVAKRPSNDEVKDEKKILAEIKAGFLNYADSGTIFTWRHHRNLARIIAGSIDGDSKSVLDVLIQQRINICNAYQKTRSTICSYGLQDLLSGDFMQHLETSILQLQKLLEPELITAIGNDAVPMVLEK